MMDDNSFILELSNRSIKLIAQLLHMAMIDDPDSEMVKKTFDELRSQTNTVYTKAERHDVWSSQLLPPNGDDIRSMSDVYFKPYRVGENK